MSFEFSSTTRVSEADNQLAEAVRVLQQRMTLAAPSVTYPTDERTRTATVRMPIGLYEALTVEAHDRHTSLNKLCIAKLSCELPAGLEVPNDRQVTA